MFSCKWKKYWSIDNAAKFDQKCVANIISYKQIEQRLILHWKISDLKKKMEFVHNQRVEVISMAIALVAIVGGTAYYYYLTTKKHKGFIFVFYLLFYYFFSNGFRLVLVLIFLRKMFVDGCVKFVFDMWCEVAIKYLCLQNYKNRT